MYLYVLRCRTPLFCDEKNCICLILFTTTAQTAMSVYSQYRGKPNTIWNPEGRLWKISITLCSRKFINNHKLQVVR